MCKEEVTTDDGISHRRKEAAFMAKLISKKVLGTEVGV